MKKLLSVIATALFAVVALAGCGSSTDTVYYVLSLRSVTYC